MTSERSVRARLATERAAAAASLEALRERFALLLDDSYVNTDDEHDIEGASIPFEREQVRATLREASARLAEIEAASARLATGDYGVCAACGGAIEAGRLDARPWVRVCIRCASRPGRH
ncbi:TraR/DksA C4-type zinc finger protein [Pseudofrankia sp. DC12]|uniref:TraR/DksA family transcriptional regulator n=1 Tax=Pseudofrankia sp. DC12 TaxID=683315 RepID=UPI0005F84A10|nr:TraR/DksA C4-type zinc finger protein [Pseudofrankia sp. DC12]